MRTCFFILMLSVSAGIFSNNNNCSKPSETEKIQRLIKYVRSLQGATFIRNGSEHTPAEAADHMELKLKKAGSKVRTAVQFITYCASKSSVSGKDYMVRLQSGKMVKSMDLLVEELKRIEKENS